MKKLLSIVALVALTGMQIQGSFQDLPKGYSGPTRTGTAVDVGASVEERNKQESLNNALIKAAIAGDINMVKQALDNGADINAQHPQHGTTALMYAATNGHDDIVTWLLTKGADANIKDKIGNTAEDYAFMRLEQTGLKKK